MAPPSLTAERIECATPLRRASSRRAPPRTCLPVCLVGVFGSFSYGCEDFEPTAQHGCTIADIVDGSVVIRCVDGAVVSVGTNPKEEIADSGLRGSMEATDGLVGPGRVDGGDGGSSKRGADGVAGSGLADPSAFRNTIGGDRRRNVIVVIGDGMHYAHQVAASRYRYGSDRGLSFHRFDQQAFVTTWSVTSYNDLARQYGAVPYSEFTQDAVVGYDPNRGGYAPYPLVPETTALASYFLPPEGIPCTDSAAAATALSTGHKAVNGYLCKADDGHDFETSAERLRALYGMALGVVTTGPVTDATPAAFVSHVANRGEYTEIARQMIDVTRPEVVIGGGFRGTSGDAFVLQSQVDAIRASSDYVYVERADGIDGGQSLAFAASQAVSQHKKLWALYGGADRGMIAPPVALDGPGHPTLQRTTTLDPILPQAATAALEVLSGHSAGFLLMVEQATIDKVSHDWNYTSMLGAVWELDDTVQAIVDYVDRPDDPIDWSNTTLFVVADHATGYLRFGAALGAGELPQSEDAIRWSAGHTNELVTLSAFGARAHRLQAYMNVYPGHPILDNTAVYALTLDAAER